MKNIIITILMFYFSLGICKAQETYNRKLVESVIEAKFYPTDFDYIFMYKELIEVYKQDTIKFNTDITKFNKSTYGKPCDDYYFDVIKFSLKKELLNYKNICSQQENLVIVNNLIKAINIDTYPIKPKIYDNWRSFYNCFFEDPGDEKDFSVFTLLFMGEDEFLSFINDNDNLNYWETSVILDLTVGGGDFIDNNQLNGTNILFIKKAEYILNKWRECKNPTIIQTMEAFKIALTKSKN